MTALQLSCHPERMVVILVLGWFHPGSGWVSSWFWVGFILVFGGFIVVFFAGFILNFVFGAVSLCAVLTRDGSFLANACFPHDAGARPLLGVRARQPLALRSKRVSKAWLGRVRAIVELCRCGVAAASRWTLDRVRPCRIYRHGNNIGQAVGSPLELGTVAWVPYGYVRISSALQIWKCKTTADMCA